jgi:hypothetical protein
MRVAPWISVLAISVASFVAGAILVPALGADGHWGRRETVGAIMTLVLVFACAQDLLTRPATGKAVDQRTPANDAPAV